MGLPVYNESLGVIGKNDSILKQGRTWPGWRQLTEAVLRE